MATLPTQQFAEVVNALRDRSTNDARDKRTATRIEVGSKVVLWPVGDDGKPKAAISVFARDISLNGIGLIQSLTFDQGQRFIVGLPRPKREPVLIHCRTTHCRELADGVFTVGAAFEGVVARG